MSPRQSRREAPGADGADPVAVDPRAVRVSMAPSTALDDDPTLVVAPPSADAGAATVDGRQVPAHLRRLDDARATLETPAADDAEARAGGRADRSRATERTRVLLGPVRRGPGGAAMIREVVVDGWRFEVAIEPEQRARLRERARRGEAAGAAGGPVEVRAIIPGRVVAISVQAGDPVVAGQQILVVEAMKMQNELRAPREGSVDRVGVAVGDTIEVGDLLVVIH